MKKLFLSLSLIGLFLFAQYSYSATRADSNITIDGTKYTLCINLPKGFDAAKSYPLVIALHYCGGSAEQYCGGLSTFCDSLQVIVASPEDNSTSALATNAFITASIDTIKSIYKIKSEEVYLTGMSCNGVTVLKEGLSKLYPFKGIFPWVPYVESVDNKVMNLKSDMPTVLSVGTNDYKLNVILSFYDSLRFYGNKVNLVIANGIGHEFGFGTFESEMIKCFRYLNDTNRIVINKIDDITMNDNDPVKELVVNYTYSGDKTLNANSRTSDPGSLPIPLLTKSNNQVTMKIDPISVKTNRSIYVVIELSEKDGMAIEQAVFKVNIKSTYNAIDLTNPEVFSVYPVPAHNQLFLKSNEKEVSLEVSDMVGKIVVVKSNFDISSPLNISGLKRGAYLLTATGNSFKKTIKFIIE